MKEFHSLFKNDYAIGQATLEPALVQKMGGGIATTPQGRFAYQRAKFIYDHIVRLMPQIPFLSNFNEKISGAAVRFHLKSALRKSHSIGELKRTLDFKLQKGDFNNATKQVISKILSRTEQAQQNIVKDLDNIKNGGNENKEANINGATAGRGTPHPLDESIAKNNPTTQQNTYKTIFELAKEEKQAKAQAELAKKQADSDYIAQLEARKNARIEKIKQMQKESQGETTLEARAKIKANEMGDDIPYQRLADTHIILEDTAYPAEFVLINKNDLKPSFEAGGFQTREVKQDDKIAKIRDNFDPLKIFGKIGEYDGLPLIARNGEIITGNHRGEAIKQLTGENLAKFKEYAKKVFGIDLSDEQIIVRRILDDTESENGATLVEQIALAARSNKGSERTLGEQATAALGEHKDKIAQLQANPSRRYIESESVENQKSAVARLLGAELKEDEANLALLASLSKASYNLDIAKALDLIQGNDLLKGKIKNMLIANAGGFYNIANSLQLPKLNEITNYLVDAIAYLGKSTAENPNATSINRSEAYRDLTKKIMDRVNGVQSFETMETPLKRFIHEAKSDVLGATLAKFANQDFASQRLYEVLKEMPEVLEDRFTQASFDFFGNGGFKSANEIDMYDFLDYLVGKGQQNEATSALKDALIALKKLESSHTPIPTPATEPTPKNALDLQFYISRNTSNTNPFQIKDIDELSQKVSQDKEIQEILAELESMPSQQEVSELAQKARTSQNQSDIQAFQNAQAKRNKQDFLETQLHNEILKHSDPLYYSMLFPDSSFAKEFLAKNGLSKDSLDEVFHKSLQPFVNEMVAGKQTQSVSIDTAQNAYNKNLNELIDNAKKTTKGDITPHPMPYLNGHGLDRNLSAGYNQKTIPPKQKIKLSPELEDIRHYFSSELDFTNQEIRTAKDFVKQAEQALKDLPKDIAKAKGTDKEILQKRGKLEREADLRKAKADLAKFFQEKAYYKAQSKQLESVMPILKQAEQDLQSFIQNPSAKNLAPLHTLKNKLYATLESTQNHFANTQSAELKALNAKLNDALESTLSAIDRARETIALKAQNPSQPTPSQAKIQNLKDFIADTRYAVDNLYANNGEVIALMHIDEMLTNTSDKHQTNFLRRLRQEFLDFIDSSQNAATHDKNEVLQKLQHLQASPLPKEISEADFLESGLEKVINKDTFLAHLKSKSDAHTRLKYLNLIEPTLESKDIALRVLGKNGEERNAYLKVFEYSKNGDKKLFYTLITEQDDKYLITGYPINKIKEVERMIKNAKSVEYFAGRPTEALRTATEKNASSLSLIMPQMEKSLEKKFNDLVAMFQKRNKTLDMSQFDAWLTQEANHGNKEALQYQAELSQYRKLDDLQRIAKQGKEKREFLTQRTQEWIQKYKDDLSGGKTDTEIIASFNIDTQKGKSDLAFMRRNIESNLGISPAQEFGTNYAEFYRDGAGGIQKLLAEANAAKQAGQDFSGQVAGAFSKDFDGRLNEIDLVWGNEKMGLQKIYEKHLSDFSEFSGQNPQEKLANGIQEIITQGEVITTHNGYNIKHNDFIVGLNKGWNENGIKKGNNKWIVTAFDNSKGISEKATAANFTKGAAQPSNLANESISKIAKKI